MSETLCSVGLDVGTTTTQLVVSRLQIENKAGSFSVPELAITEREIVYKSQVHFTPLIRDELVDAPALKAIVDAEYRAAGIRREDVDTGVIIITGETSRKENARAVLDALSDYAGDFVVATAGPDLESILAAKGSHAVALSRKYSRPVLHMDIGGGTSNLSLIEDGKITATGCLNVGGRLLKIQENGILSYVSPVLRDIFPKTAGESVSQAEVRGLAETLAQVLEMAAGLRPATNLLQKLTTLDSGRIDPPDNAILSFSGGVADCIATVHPYLAFGDLGPELGQAIAASRLCQGNYVLGKETVRATVIGAGGHSVQLSGSTVYHQGVRFPLKNVPVLPISGNETQEQLQTMLRRFDTVPVLYLPQKLLDYGAVCALADKLSSLSQRPMLITLRQDAAKAVGQALALRMGPEEPLLCIDRIRLSEEGFLDVGAPVGSALPVVIKTLALGT